MEESVRSLFDNFIKTYDTKTKDQIWASHSQKFRDFWNTKIVPGNPDDLTDQLLDDIIRILDVKAKGNTKKDEAVANVMIPQGIWKNIFREISSNKQLSNLITNILIENNPQKKAEYIDNLYKLNDGKKNSLTGPSGNAINTLLAAYDPINNLTIISVKDRLAIIKHFALPFTFDDEAATIGVRFIETNRIIIEAFNELDMNESARTISCFFYHDSVLSFWKKNESSGKEKVKKQVKTKISSPQLNNGNRVWFVCQGSTFSEENGRKLLWAPKEGKNGKSFFHWKNMENIKKGDIIFNYSEGVKGVSIATSNVYTSNNPFSTSEWQEEGYKVDIELTLLNPALHIDLIKNHKRKFDLLLSNVKYKPFNGNGGVNQGYLFEFSPEAGKLIREIYGKKFGNETIDTFFDKVNPVGITTIIEPEKVITHIHKYVTNKGFNYKYEEIANFYLALRVKPFVILAGISGTGKTQLPRKFASAIGMTKEQVIQIPVRPDWTDGSDLLGYIGLDENFKPKDLTLAIKNAFNNPDKPYFFILDEMNLARVEHYFSDFLSIIETRERNDDKITTDPILKEELLKGAKNGSEFKSLGWPQNLFLVGTVNMDETTHAFSRKVLDRANSIEMNEVDLNWLPDSKVDVEPLVNIGASFFMTPFLSSKELSEENKESIKGNMSLLIQVNKILEKADLHFAYRVRDEVAFYLILNKKYNFMDSCDALDFQLVQKVLPRIHGSSERIQMVLVELLNLLEGKDYRSKDFEYSQIEDKIDLDNLKYKRASKKILFMLKRFDNDRFTSFWL